MTRTTLLIPEDLRRSSFAEARRRGLSFGAFVREALRDALRQAHEAGRVGDSFLDDSGVYAGPVPTDSSTRIDDALYGERE